MCNEFEVFKVVYLFEKLYRNMVVCKMMDVLMKCVQFFICSLCFLQFYIIY